eukprot:COSAG04_NODE_24935_length_314_cov_1.297674_1_plen_47_part_10
MGHPFTVLASLALALALSAAAAATPDCRVRVCPTGAADEAASGSREA